MEHFLINQQVFFITSQAFSNKSASIFWPICDQL